MTEKEWLNGRHLRPMLYFLRGKVSDRKLRLFACGFCTTNDTLLADETCREAVEVAERFADGLAGPEELAAARHAARLVWASFDWHGKLAAEAAESDGWTAASGVQSALEMDDIPRNYWKRQTRLLRDIFGPLPFRSISLDPAWLTSTVKQLATTIYQERAFDRLPFLADALEDAGCNKDDILKHFRRPGVHVRGCWPLDLVLGKE
jgi:hypothetical protein